MAKWFLVLLLLIGGGVGALWYYIHRPQQQALTQAQGEVTRLQGQATRCGDDLRTLQGQLADLQTVRAELQKASLDLQQKVQEKEGELVAIRSAQDELLTGLKKEIESQQIQVQRYRDQLRVDMVNEVLFDSGEAEVKAAGKVILEKVANVLKKTDGRKIDIQGHTDNVPIVGALTKRYATNWELSAARAVNVARFLQQSGVDPKWLAATAHSEYDPRAGNDTDEGRQKNRRIEILLGSRIAPAAETAAPKGPGA
jgi:chemotaxis protein MotB